MTQTIDRTTTFFVEDCCACFVPFAITKAFEDAARADGRTFYCPNGHGQSYTDTEVARQRKRAERLERSLANTEESLRIERASHSATKGQLTKTKRRADKGVCLHCHRSFANVARHMASQHTEVSA